MFEAKKMRVEKDYEGKKRRKCVKMDTENRNYGKCHSLICKFSGVAVNTPIMRWTGRKKHWKMSTLAKVFTYMLGW